MRIFIASIFFILLASRSALFPHAQASVEHEQADTLAHTQDEQGQAALKPIASPNLGDKVLAKSEWKAEAESLSYEPITDIMVTPAQPRRLVDLVLADGQTITTTDGHPFNTPEGWRVAILLKKGGNLLLKGDGESDRTVEIASVTHRLDTQTTYNLEVANAHTFFVGVEGVLVHNGRVKPPAPGRPTPVNTDGGFKPGKGSGHYKYWPDRDCYGWRDKDGDVWEPTDHNGTHRPHWDRQHPNGNHTPTYPSE
jgi:hypothetical protein